MYEKNFQTSGIRTFKGGLLKIYERIDINSFLFACSKEKRYRFFH